MDQVEEVKVVRSPSQTRGVTVPPPTLAVAMTPQLQPCDPERGDGDLPAEAFKNQ